MTRKTLAGAAMAAVLALAIYGLTLPLRQDVTFGRRSLAYFVLVAPRTVVRTFPVHQPRTALSYEYDAADGPAPARIAEVFETSADAEGVLDAYGRYCAERGYQTLLRPGGLTCRARGYDIAIEARAEPGRNVVIVVFEEEG